ncbi:MAG: ferritin family protein [Candidatus Aminicenantes bacterium]|nr:ferritin family protein [Candidatus Aminicenantes bacterium]
MTIDPKLKAADVYPFAIRAELDAAALYRGLWERVRNEALRQKLNFLAKEEDRHTAILDRLFRDHFPGRKLVVPAAARGPRKPVLVDDATAVVSLFKLAMQKEKEAEEYYKSAKAQAEDGQAKRILDYLARVERSHYFMLKSEIDLLERFPDYYNVEDANEGQDLFHIGA